MRAGLLLAAVATAVAGARLGWLAQVHAALGRGLVRLSQVQAAVDVDGIGAEYTPGAPLSEDFHPVVANLVKKAMQEALDAGKVDLGQFPQPFAALAEKQMKVRKIFDAKYGIPFEEELIVLIGKDEFLKKNASVVRGLLEDLKSATAFYLESPREARQLLIDRKMVRVNPDVYVGMNDYYRDPSLQVDIDALEKMQAFQIKAGFQKKNADVRSLVDLSYLPK